MPRRHGLLADLDRPGDVFAGLGPNWFASVMGTGIVATAAADLPVPWPGLRGFAAAVWVLSAVWLITLAGAEVVLWTRHRDAARAHARDPVMVQFLPPAWVSAYQFDVTRDEVLNYARLLIQAGVPCDLQHYGAAFHLAHQFPGTAIGERMINDRMQAIRRLLPRKRHVTASRNSASRVGRRHG